MKIPANIAERYVSAVERETERNRLYGNLIAAQTAHEIARRALVEAEANLKSAQLDLEEFDL